MRILIVHNRYLQQGGEDVAVEAEAALLAAHGHDVQRYETSNEDMLHAGRARSAARTFWSAGSRTRMLSVNQAFKPDVVHVHNTFPRLSPSVYYACRDAAVVQTLHNYRLVCPAGTLMRNGAPCEACVGRFAWPGVLHACYRGSRSASLITATMVEAHHAVATWQRRVDAYIALTPFTRDVFVRGGLPEAKLHVKPNFVSPDPGMGNARGDHMLFVGRFEDGKGVRVLMAAWGRMKDAPPLRIIGSGPLEEDVRAFAAARGNVTLLGRVSRERVIDEMKTARALVAPLLWYENFPLAICEAMATGCPVIAADVANVSAILGDGRCGVLFTRGNADALADAVQRTVREPALLETAARHARTEYETHYTADVNYRMLLDIYDAAMARKAVIA